MSSEFPPFPITNTYNESAWIQDTGGGLSQVTADGRYLSKLVASTAQGIISFVLGLKSNLITVYSGNTLTIGEGGGTKNVSLYYPYLAVALLDPADNTALIPSTSWVNNWFSNILTTSGLVWTQAQEFAGGVKSNSLVPQTSTSPFSIAPSSTAITIATSQANTNTIGIGASGSIVSVPGATTLGSISCNSINSVTSGATVNIMSTSTTGIVNIATASNRSGVCHVADGSASTGGVHVNNGDTASGNTRCMDGSSQSGSLILGATSNSVVINVNRPLTIGYLPTAITSLTQIGRSVEVILPDVSIGFADNIVSTLTIGTAGVYIIDYSYRLNGNGAAVILCESWFNTSNQPANIQYANQSIYYNPAVVAGSLICQAGSAVVTTTSTSTVIFHIFVDKAGANLTLVGNFSYYGYTRIA